MVRDDRFYAFIVARTSRSRSRIRRISIHKRSIKLLVLLSVVLFGVALYGFYGLTQQAMHLRIERENARLRAENEKQRLQLNNLNHRVGAVEDKSRRLAEMSGVDSSTADEQPSGERGAGGPSIPLDTPDASNTERVLSNKLSALRTLCNERRFPQSGLSRAQLRAGSAVVAIPLAEAHLNFTQARTLTPTQAMRLSRLAAAQSSSRAGRMATVNSSS